MLFNYVKFGQICLYFLHVKCLILHEKNTSCPGRSCLPDLQSTGCRDLFLGVITAQLPCSCFTPRLPSLGYRPETGDWVKWTRYLVWFIMTALFLWSHSPFEHTSAQTAHSSSGRQLRLIIPFHLNMGKIRLAEDSFNLNHCKKR